MKSVGIDIGTSSIKVVEVTSSNKGVVISHFHQHPLGQNPAFDPELEILEYLKNLSTQYDPTTTKFIGALRQERVSVRFKIFPFADRQKILKSLPFELEEDLPFSSETAIYDSKIIKTMGSTAELLAAAAPKVRIQEVLTRMQSSGIELAVLSAEGVALANCFEKWSEAPQALPPQTVDLDPSLVPPRNIRAIVYIGHIRTLVLAFEDQQLLGVRSIYWGAKNIADAIARRYEIPFIEAMNEMKSKAFILPSKEGASYDQVVFSDTIGNQIRELGRELKISLLEFNSDFNGQLNHVHLTGGGSGVLNMHTLLTQILEVPVNKLVSITDIPLANTVERTQSMDASMGVALGLALEGLKKPRNPALNFLRGEFVKQNLAARIFFERWAPTMKVAAAAFVIFFVYASLRETATFNLIEAAERNAAVISTKILNLKVKKGEDPEFKRKPMKNFISSQQKRSKELQQLKTVAAMNSAMDIIKKISDGSPGKNLLALDVKALKVLDSSVLIEGTVKSLTEKEALKRSLIKLSSNGKVTELPPKLGSVNNGVAFGYEFPVDRGVKR
jgi:general secretion pathway protein L